MSAELLRQAASLMRERADLPYVTGEWETNGRFIRKSSSSPRIGYPAHAEASCQIYEAEDEALVNEAIAEHVASWHPAVALAVADWLDTQVARWEQVYTDTQQPSAGVDEPPGIHYGDTFGAANTANHHTRHALAVARAYLGSES